MKFYRLIQKQEMKRSPSQVWEFISRPENLNSITPPELDFRIVNDVPEVMAPGVLIEYSIRIPFMGRRRWLTEIKHIREGESFVDEQRFGPYKFWFHHHEIRTENGRTVMRDVITYALPFGILGRIMHALVVGRMLRSIFDYRYRTLEGMGI